MVLNYNKLKGVQKIEKKTIFYIKELPWPKKHNEFGIFRKAN